MIISVVGLGYVGFPAALAFHKAGFSVNGIDTSELVVSMIIEGESPIKDSSEQLEIPEISSNWLVSSSYEKIAESDVVIITVPTPTKNVIEPDLSFVISAFRSVLSNIDSGKETIVILESTVSPGTTRGVAELICKDLNLEIGTDFNLGYSPERVSPGEGKNVSNVSRIIGSDTPEIGELIVQMYSKVTSGECRLVSSIEVAEAAKMIENVQRDIDIAFVNELSIILPEMGLDVDEVLEAASSKWSFHRHYPGIGVGGHCIPVDPYYYIDASNNLGVPSMLGPAARSINEAMPILSAKTILNSIDRPLDSKRALILGYSYKPELGDTRMTPTLQLIRELHKAGLEVLVWDPHVDPLEITDSVEIVDDPLIIKDLDIVILATAHSICLNLDWVKLLKNCKSGLLFDGRRALDVPTMESIGWKYSGVGYPG
jgi:nucleotide sugar dehydrogenase